jgi:hypothetical protein
MSNAAHPTNDRARCVLTVSSARAIHIASPTHQLRAHDCLDLLLRVVHIEQTLGNGVPILKAVGAISIAATIRYLFGFFGDSHINFSLVGRFLIAAVSGNASNVQQKMGVIASMLLGQTLIGQKIQHLPR